MAEPTPPAPDTITRAPRNVRPLRNSPRTKPDPSNWSPSQVPSGRSSSALQAPAMRAVGVISSASDKVVTLCGMVTRAPLRLVTRASAASVPA